MLIWEWGTNMTKADELNSILEHNGKVQVSTYCKSVMYSKRHAGMFFMRGENLCVKHGAKSSNQLTIGDTYLVSVRHTKLQEVA